MNDRLKSARDKRDFTKGGDGWRKGDVTIASEDTRLGYNEARYGTSGHCMFLP